MQTVEHVLGLLKAAVPILPEEAVAFTESIGRVLSRAVISDIDSPPFDRAMRDGYAVMAADTPSRTPLRILGQQDAGAESDLRVTAGTCVAINTGAKIPAGADAVVMVEDSQMVEGGKDARGRAEGAGMVSMLKPASRGQHIQPKASDAAAGRAVLATGTRVTAAGLAVAASSGAARVQVFRRPRVAILTTGDEVVPVEQTPGPVEIRNSNSPMLAALARAAGAEVIDLGIAVDEIGALTSAVKRGLACADVLVITGGMSMGTKDLVPPLLEELGLEILVTAVKIKPGKPFLFASSGGGGLTFVAGLPGNPVSAFVCFVRFVQPFLRAMAGGAFDVNLETAIADGALAANESREFYQPGKLYSRDNQLCVRPLEWRGSADIYTLAEADALIVHGAGETARAAQMPVRILRL